MVLSGDREVQTTLMSKIEKKTIERLRSKILENKEKFKAETALLKEKFAVETALLKGELQKLKDEHYEIKRHMIKKSNGTYEIDYVMYCITSKSRLELQYAKLQEDFLLLAEDNNKCRELTKHFNYMDVKEMV